MSGMVGGQIRQSTEIYQCLWSNVHNDIMSGMIDDQIRQHVEIYMSLVNCQ